MPTASARGAEPYIRAGSPMGVSTRGVCDVVAGYDARGRRVANVWCIARSVMCERVFAERVIYQRSSGGGRRAAGVH